MRFNGIIPVKQLTKLYKGDSHVSVTFQLAKAEWLPKETKDKLAEIHKSSLSHDGFLTIHSNKTNRRTLNLADCMDILRCYISEAEQPPPPEQSLENIKHRLERDAATILRQTF